MDKLKIDRINQLAKKAKTTGLNEQEKAEQHLLRQEYILSFRNSLAATLESAVIVDETGKKRKLEKKKDKPRH